MQTQTTPDFFPEIPSTKKESYSAEKIELIKWLGIYKREGLKLCKFAEHQKIPVATVYRWSLGQSLPRSYTAHQIARRLNFIVQEHRKNQGEKKQ